MSIKEKFKNLASSGLNKLPPSANLFLRYYSGLGAEGLDFRDDYLDKVRESTKSADQYSGRFDEEFIDEEGNRKMADKAIEPGKKSTERYLPKAAWAAMSKSERKKTDDKKKRESRKGKQFVENTKKARKARKMASKRAARSMK